MSNQSRKVDELLKSNQMMVKATLSYHPGSTSRPLKLTSIVLENGTLFGTIGGGRLEREVITKAKTVFETKQPATFHIELIHIDMDHSYISDIGQVDLFLEPVFPENQDIKELLDTISQPLEKNNRELLHALRDDNFFFTSDEPDVIEEKAEAITESVDTIDELLTSETPSDEEGSGKTIQLQVVHKGDPPPCLKKIVQCRGCNGWRPMLKAAREIPLWQKYPFGCVCTGLVVRYVEEGDGDA